MKDKLNRGLGLLYVTAIVGNNFGGSIVNAMGNKWWDNILEFFRAWFGSQKRPDSRNSEEKELNGFMAKEFSKNFEMGEDIGSFEVNSKNKNFRPFCKFKSGMIYGIEEKDKECSIISEKIIDGRVVESMPVLSSDKNCEAKNIEDFYFEVKYIATLAKFEDFLEKNRSLFSLKENSTGEYMVKDGKFNIFINKERLDSFVWFGVEDHCANNTQVRLKCRSKDSTKYCNIYNFRGTSNGRRVAGTVVDRKTATEMLEAIIQQTEDYKKKIAEEDGQNGLFTRSFSITRAEV